MISIPNNKQLTTNKKEFNPTIQVCRMVWTDKGMLFCVANWWNLSLFRGMCHTASFISDNGCQHLPRPRKYWAEGPQPARYHGGWLKFRLDLLDLQKNFYIKRFLRYFFIHIHGNIYFSLWVNSFDIPWYIFAI